MPTLFDMLALGAVALSAVVSLMRGLVAEVLSLLSWIAALAAAKAFSPQLAQIAFSGFKPPELGVVAAFLLIFVGVCIGLRLLCAVLTQSLSAVGLGGINRLAGALFGCLKGVILVTLAVLVCAFTELPQNPQWREARTAPFFEGLALKAVPYLPSLVAGRIQYPPTR